MEEKYEEFLSIKCLLDEVTTLRQNKIYKKMLKETYRAEMESLRNVEIELYNPESKFTDPKKWPIAKNIPLPKLDVNEPIKGYNQILAALNCLESAK